MSMHKLSSMFLAATLVAFAVDAQAAITIPTVAVGNPGNAGEVQSQGTFGAVPYNYRIGTTEVSNAQYVAFLNGVGETAVTTYGLYNAAGGITNTGSGETKYAVAATNLGIGRANAPVSYVSWYDTLRFANWLTNGQGAGDTESGSYTIINGGVNSGTVTMPSHATLAAESKTYWLLPSEDEWYKAAYYDPNKSGSGVAGYHLYPTGDTVTATAGGTAAGTAVFGQFAAADISNAGGLSAYGTMGQGGNAWEWNEAIISLARGFRGGGWGDDSNGLAASYRNYNDPTAEGNAVGFRVASVPEPGSIILIVSGAIAAWILWRRRK